MRVLADCMLKKKREENISGLEDMAKETIQNETHRKRIKK